MADWHFITNHGAVMLVISREGQITARELAQRVGITERSVLKIIKDLEEAGYLSRERVGRENVFTVYPKLAMRHNELRDVQIGELVGLLSHVGDER